MFQVILCSSQRSATYTGTFFAHWNTMCVKGQKPIDDQNADNGGTQRADPREIKFEKMSLVYRMLYGF